MTGAAVGSAPTDPLVLVDGSSFCLSGPSGDVNPDEAHGLFVRDLRVLSSWVLRVDGEPVAPLVASSAEPFAATVLGHLPPGRGRPGSLLVIRRRFLGNGMREEIVLRNHGARPATCRVRLAVAGDFADLFAVKEGRPSPPDAPGTVHGSTLVLLASRDGHEHTVVVRGGSAARPVPGALTWDVDVPARGEWHVEIEVETIIGRRTDVHGPPRVAVDVGAPARSLQAWRGDSPVIETSDPDLAAVLARSVEDIGALRIVDPEHPDRTVVAAGAPWYMALFGRDSLLTSAMVLTLDRGLALATVRTLAAHQGERVDPTSEEEPGRILHELRFGPPSALAPGGTDRYYGTADATSLFVVVLDELMRFGASAAEIEPLLAHADRALEWVERYGDRDGDGFVEYLRATDRGLLNQGWKDSHDGITFADGRVAEPPLALAEVQGYTYAAYRARAHLADAFSDRATSRRCSERAEALARRFDEQFWLPDRGWFALALDGDKRPVDALASNMGHCLWSGIVRPDRAPAVAARLLSPEMFSGWGVRTLGSSMGAYDPMSYHNGSVWPHDTALCVAGLVRYGFVAEARQVATGLVAASRWFGHRLPELFGGYDRAETGRPVPYPTSCSPQAWAAAAPVLLLRSLLRFDPDLTRSFLRCGPVLPEEWLPLTMRGIRLGETTVDVSADRDGWSVDGDRSGLDVLAHPADAGDRG
jgi:glycogen debranching enzyme